MVIALHYRLPDVGALLSAASLRCRLARYLGLLVKLRLIRVVVVAVRMTPGVISNLAMQLVLILETGLSSIPRRQATWPASAATHNALRVSGIAAHLKVRVVAFPALLIA